MNDPHLTHGFSEEQKLPRQSVLGTPARVLPPEKIRERDKAGKYPTGVCQAVGLSEVPIPNGIVDLDDGLRVAARIPGGPGPDAAMECVVLDCDDGPLLGFRSAS